MLLVRAAAAAAGDVARPIVAADVSRRPVAVMVTAARTYVGVRMAPTPTDAYAGGIGGFLERLAGRALAPGGGTVLVDPAAAGALGLPVDVLPAGPDAKAHPAAGEARRHGWDVREVHRWSTFAKSSTTINLGLTGLIDDGYCPLLVPDPIATTAGMSEWHRLAGVPWIGDAGDAVNALIMATAKCRPGAGGKRRPPIWRPRNRPPVDAIEHPYGERDWRPEVVDAGRYWHGLDAVRAYLAAMACVSVAAAPLTHTGRREFDPSLAGWWLVDLGRWPYAAILPDPAGYDPERRDGPRWLTTPTLQLIAQLAEDGHHEGFTVVDSWTAPGERGVLRPAAGVLEQMWRHAGALCERDRESIRRAVKSGYHTAHSKWSAQQSEIRRADWDAAVTAMCRVNLWRKLWAAAGLGYLPAAVAGIDTVYYPSDQSTPAAPAPFRLVDPDDPQTDPKGRYLGQYAAKKLIDRWELAA